MNRKPIVFHKDEILIEGRENSYLVVPNRKGVVLYIRFGQKGEWSIDDKFKTVADALPYINSCLAYESDGLAWRFRTEGANKELEME